MKKKKNIASSIRQEGLEKKLKKETFIKLKLQRDLEIESSLERVRKVAMGMKNPADMLKICETISQQLQKLGVKEIRNVQTAIFYESKGTYMNYEYYAKHHKTFITETSYSDHKIHKAFATQMLKGKGEFFISHIKGKKVKDWIAYQKTTNVFIDKYLNTASSLNYYWFSLGPVALGISTYHPLTEEEENLFKRFLNVFELAYRRYLDIEKAEAQAREAKIELSLERVRARAMSMQRSDELAELVSSVFNELTQLDFTLTSCIIWIHEHERSSNTLWIASSEMNKPAQPFQIKPFHESFFRSIILAWKAKDPKWIFTLTGVEKKNFEKAFFKEIPDLPDALRKALKVPKQVVFSASFNNFGALEIVETDALTDEKFDILHRFGKVFEMSYTRFHDLQKAEAQAREAQIENALEKVRSRTMAMQKSEELLQVITTLFDQFRKLDIKMDGVHIQVFNDTKDFNLWIANQDQDYVSSLHLPYFDHPFFNNFWDKYEAGENLITEYYNRTEKDILFNHFFEYSDLKKTSPTHKKFLLDSAGWSRSIAFGKNTALISNNFNNTIPYSSEENEILKRFAAVFEQTYTRFLDLQKAEAQTREAEIELALERIRARTMAMQKSDELSEAAILLHRQFSSLAALPVKARMVISILNEESHNFDLYITTTDGSQLNKSFSYSIEEPYVFHPAYLAVKNKKKSFVIDLSGKSLAEYLAYMEKSRYPITFRDRAVITCATFSSGYFCLVTAEPVSADILQLLQRFAGVFDHTYTRFLDLEKAEAQARESEIELALERVRAKTMAMQKSEELKDVVKVMNRQFDSFAVAEWGCSIMIFDKKANRIENWVAESTNSDLSCYIIEGQRHPVYKRLWKHWEQQAPTVTLHHADEVKREFDNFWLYETDYKRLPDEVKSTVLNEREIFLTYSSMHHGLISVAGNKQLSEDQISILDRFSKVFQQTYTRFLDLQKAEAQAREAQIEAALERVRARSMGMHKSEELVEVVRILDKEINGLGVEVNGTQILTDFANSEVGLNDWYAMEGQDYLEKFHVPYLEHPLTKRFINALNKNVDFYTENYSKAEKNKYFRLLFKYSDFGKIPKERQELVYNLPAWIRATVLFKNSILIFQRFDLKEFTKEEEDIFKRFGKVFEQAYTRFLDLQKAEEQAREAQIEAALERVRSSSLAMHRSQDLAEVMSVVFQQLNALGISNIIRCWVA
ncbi:MAG: hypothetical protein JJE22_06710, partial [Bacteroidia bacterium]|nr:hypothetical protein [Bacteroidia bacterium]